MDSYPLRPLFLSRTETSAHIIGTKSRIHSLYKDTKCRSWASKPWAVAFSLLCCQRFLSNMLSKILSSIPPCGVPGLGVSGAGVPGRCWSAQSHRELHREGNEDFNAFDKILSSSLEDVNIPKVVQNRKMCHWLRHLCFVLFIAE